MSVKVYIFGKEINRRIYLWPRIWPEKLHFWENHKKQGFFAPNYFVQPLNKFLSKIAKNWYTPCSDMNLATDFFIFSNGPSIVQRSRTPYKKMLGRNANEERAVEDNKTTFFFGLIKWQIIPNLATNHESTQGQAFILHNKFSFFLDNSIYTLFHNFNKTNILTIIVLSMDTWAQCCQ